MGQKVHPYGFRLGYNKNWQSRWFSKKDYPAFVYEDHEVRKYVKKLLYSAGISKIEIERAGGKIRLILSTARPGIVIGRKGVEIEKLRNDLRAKFGREFSLEVNEIRRPEVDSQLVAENIAQQLERRVPSRHEAHGDDGPQIRCRRHQGDLLRSSRRCGNRPHRMVPRRSRAVADPACRHRLRLRRSAYHVRHHRRQGVDLQR